MVDTLKKFKNLKHSEELLLAYKGDITDNLTSNLLSIAENKLATVEYNSKIKKKVFNILVEVVQNIYHNQNEIRLAEKIYHELMIMLVKTPTSYEVVSGNFILHKNTDELRKRIDEVNLMTNEQLRAQYRSKLDKGVFSEKGRVGLGIMDMVRKSGRSLDYGFKSVNEKYDYFSLQVNINH